MVEVVLALGVGGLVTTSEGQLVNCKLDKVVHCEGEQIYLLTSELVNCEG